MPDTWAYDLDDDKLMDALWKATVRAGASNSGLVIDCAAGYHAEEAFYFHGVVLSRLKGERPPFAPGDKVRMCSKETWRCGSVNSIYRGEYSSSGEAKPDTEYEVRRIFYEKGVLDKEPRWAISFKNKEDSEQEGYRFPVSRFEKIEQEAAATA